MRPFRLQILTLVFALLAVSGIGAEVPAYVTGLRTDPENVFLNLDQGSLVESIVFRRFYTAKYRGESAIVVVLPDTDNVAGAAVYTKNGQVWVHRRGLGNVPLAAFEPADLVNKITEIEAAVRHLLDTASKPPSNEASAREATAGQLARAFECIHDLGETYLPSARTLLPLEVKKAGGLSVTYPAGSIVFDWNEQHYFYHPDLGVNGEPLPVDPVTGRPYLCVPHGDLIESVAFYYNFRKTHPGEKVTVLAPMPGQKPGRGGFPLTMAAVAYTKEGETRTRSHILGDIPATSLAPAGMQDPAALHAVYVKTLGDKLDRAHGRRSPEAPGKSRPGPTVQQAEETLGTAIRHALPGDTPEMQVRRAFYLLREATGSWVVHLKTGYSPDGLDEFRYLMIFCEDRAYQYKSTVPSVHRLHRDRLEPATLVSGLLFTLKYQKEHPEEQTYLLPNNIPNTPRVFPLYSKEGVTYYYYYTVGSLPLPGIKPEDWHDPARQEEIIALCKKVAEVAHQKEWDNRQSVSADDLAKEAEEEKAFETESVYRVFKEAGIPCEIVNERTQGEDGHMREYPVPTLSFEWQGARYTYNLLRECARAPGYFPPFITIATGN